MFTKTFENITKKDVEIAGGKGASLGEMINATIPVPPGFIVLANAFDRFLEEADLTIGIDSIISKVNHEDVNSVNDASVKIRDLIKNSEFSQDIAKEIKEEYKKLDAKYIAVRSSATAEDSGIASWAGELESYLNVVERDILESVKKCWSSLFTPRAIFYRFEKKLNTTKISVAVVVQKMVQAEVSGVCFTVHPVTKDENQMVIEAGYGLGEAIVGGLITPDMYVVDKTNYSLMDINISEQKMMIAKTSKDGAKEINVPEPDRDKQKLDNKSIIELARLCHDIEKHYGFPCDIEWAMENNRLYITQSRPITTLN